MLVKSDEQVLWCLQRKERRSPHHYCCLGFLHVSETAAREVSGKQTQVILQANKAPGGQRGKHSKQQPPHTDRSLTEEQVSHVLLKHCMQQRQGTDKNDTVVLLRHKSKNKNKKWQSLIPEDDGPTDLIFSWVFWTKPQRPICLRCFHGSTVQIQSSKFGSTIVQFWRVRVGQEYILSSINCALGFFFLTEYGSSLFSSTC